MKKAKLTRKDIMGKVVVLPLTVDTFAEGYKEVGYNCRRLWLELVSL